MSIITKCDLCGESIDAKPPNLDELVYATVRNSGFGPHHRIDICRECLWKFDKMRKAIVSIDSPEEIGRLKLIKEYLNQREIGLEKSAIRWREENNKNMEQKEGNYLTEIKELKSLFEFLR